MDFITKFLRTVKEFDAIRVIIDHLINGSHFLTIREGSSVKKLANFYVREIVPHYGVPVFIVSDCDECFTSWFWQRFHEELGTRLYFSTAYHPLTDGQSEQTIQML